NSRAGDEPAAFDRHHLDASRGIFRIDRVWNRHQRSKRQLDHVLLCITRRLVDGRRRVDRFAKTDADAAFMVAGNYSDGKSKPAASGCDTGHAADVDHFRVEFRLDAVSTARSSPAWT